MVNENPLFIPTSPGIKQRIRSETKLLFMVGWMEWMMDMLMNRWISWWNHIGVDRQMSHVTDIWMETVYLS